jgi:hypothetical protein
MNKRRILIAITIACVALLAWSGEIPGDFGHQRSGSSIDPDGHAKTHPEMVWFEVPAKHTATAAHDNWEKGLGYYESKIVVYQGDAKTEVMRFATTGPDHERNTNTVLKPGERYYFTAWHKAGDMSRPWEPSHARLLMKDATTFVLQVDDGLAGTNGGDFDFNDSNLLITVK